MKKIHPKILPDAARIMSKILIKLKVVIQIINMYYYFLAFKNISLIIYIVSVERREY